MLTLELDASCPGNTTPLAYWENHYPCSPCKLRNCPRADELASDNNQKGLTPRRHLFGEVARTAWGPTGCCTQPLYLGAGPSRMEAGGRREAMRLQPLQSSAGGPQSWASHPSFLGCHQGGHLVRVQLGKQTLTVVLKLKFALRNWL